MPLPELTLGLVVRYEYLWHRRSAAAVTVDKEHPACVVAIFRRDGSPDDTVVYLPISHTPPADDEEGIELPASVKARAGLDSAPQWVLVSECNLDVWPFDLRALPGGRTHSTMATCRHACSGRFATVSSSVIGREGSGW